MCTAHLLTISHSILCISGGGGGSAQANWMQSPGIQTPPEADPLVMWPVMPAGKPTPLWTEGMTHTCDNNTLPQTSFAGGNKVKDGYRTTIRNRGSGCCRCWCCLRCCSHRSLSCTSTTSRGNSSRDCPACYCSCSGCPCSCCHGRCWSCRTSSCCGYCHGSLR